MFRKLICLILAIALAGVPLFAGAGTVSATQEDYASLKASIEKQIRSFADSIDKANADNAAAKTLANHGLTGRGKTLKVGKSNALTATLFNSELLQNSLTDTCAAAIRYM